MKGCHPRPLDDGSLCSRRESNPHLFREQILSLPRLPVSPPEQKLFSCLNYVELNCCHSQTLHFWKRPGSNRRPTECKSVALPTELRPQVSVLGSLVELYRLHQTPYFSRVSSVQSPTRGEYTTLRIGGLLRPHTNLQSSGAGTPTGKPALFRWPWLLPTRLGAGRQKPTQNIESRPRPYAYRYGRNRTCLCRLIGTVPIQSDLVALLFQSITRFFSCQVPFRIYSSSLSVYPVSTR